MKKAELVNHKKLSDLLDEIKTELKKIYNENLKSIILYGSYAKGDYDSYSDIDIMILIDEKEENLRRYRNAVIEIVTDISIKYDVVISIIDKSYRDFTVYRNYVPFYRNVHTEGFKVYEN